MGLGDLSRDKRFDTIEKQLPNRSELNAILAVHFLEPTTQGWISKLEPLGILCTKINSCEEAAEDPQLRIKQMILETVHPRADAVNVLGTPLRIQNYERRSRKNAPPELGEHNHEILRESGYTNEKIQEFEQLGVFG